MVGRYVELPCAHAATQRFFLLHPSRVAEGIAAAQPGGAEHRFRCSHMQAVLRTAQLVVKGSFNGCCYSVANLLVADLLLCSNLLCVRTIPQAARSSAALAWGYT
ncbi:MAG: hypothetical protein K2I18_02465 [Paramuribaculum sp.]|nr:hypothetical protein [Paramuribaculum sp.]